MGVGVAGQPPIPLLSPSNLSLCLPPPCSADGLVCLLEVGGHPGLPEPEPEPSPEPLCCTVHAAWRIMHSVGCTQQVVDLTCSLVLYHFGPLGRRQVQCTKVQHQVSGQSAAQQNNSIESCSGPAFHELLPTFVLLL